MAGVGVDTKIYPREKYDRVTFSAEQGGAASSSMPDYKRYQQERFYEVQTSLTLEEARYSEMRKKIPGLGRVPKDRIHKQDQDIEFWKVCTNIFLFSICARFIFTCMLLMVIF